MKPRLHIVRPLLALAQAEKRIKQIEPRDFKANPWIMGEGVKFWTPDRIAKLAAENEQLRAARKLRKGIVTNCGRCEPSKCKSDSSKPKEK